MFTLRKGTVLNREIDGIIKDFQNGSESAFSDLYETYKPLMLSLINSIILSSFPYEGASDHDVLMQEAAMALYKAAQSYDLSCNEVTFGLYAKVCIKNRLISVKRKLVSAQKRRSRAALSESRKQTAKIQKNPYNIKSELAAGRLSEVIENNLSDFEKRVLDHYLQDMSYKEIADALNVSQKAVDNAVYRIRCKLKKHV